MTEEDDADQHQEWEDAQEADNAATRIQSLRRGLVIKRRWRQALSRRKAAARPGRVARDMAGATSRVGDSDRKGRAAHCGEWRAEDKNKWCSLVDSPDGQLCTHRGGCIINAPHWSCCGGERHDDTCAAAAAAPATAAAVAAAGGRLRVGERVTLTDDYASYGDSSSGPLTLGDVGVIEQDDRDSKPFKVRLGDHTRFYPERALRRTTAAPAVTDDEPEFGHEAQRPSSRADGQDSQHDERPTPHEAATCIQSRRRVVLYGGVPGE